MPPEVRLKSEEGFEGINQQLTDPKQGRNFLEMTMKINEPGSPRHEFCKNLLEKYPLDKIQSKEGDSPLDKFKASLHKRLKK